VGATAEACRRHSQACSLVRDGGERAYLMQALPNTFYTRSRNAAQRPRATAPLDDVDVIEPRVAVQPERAAEVREIIEAIAGRQPESCLMDDAMATRRRSPRPNWRVLMMARCQPRCEPGYKPRTTPRPS